MLLPFGSRGAALCLRQTPRVSVASTPPRPRSQMLAPTQFWWPPSSKHPHGTPSPKHPTSAPLRGLGKLPEGALRLSRCPALWPLWVVLGVPVMWPFPEDTSYKQGTYLTRWVRKLSPRPSVPLPFPSAPLLHPHVSHRGSLSLPGPFCRLHPGGREDTCFGAQGLQAHANPGHTPH